MHSFSARLLVAGLLAVVGCRYGANESSGEAEWAYYEREIMRGSSVSHFKVDMQLSRGEEFWKFANELAGRAWWMDMGEHGEPPLDCDGIYSEYLEIVEEKYPADFDLSPYGMCTTIEGRIVGIHGNRLKYRVKVTFEPVGNPAWVCEIEGTHILSK